MRRPRTASPATSTEDDDNDRDRQQQRKAEDELEAQLLEGLRSSKAALTAADWKEIRAEALAKVAARKKPR